MNNTLTTSNLPLNATVMNRTNVSIQDASDTSIDQSYSNGVVVIMGVTMSIISLSAIIGNCIVVWILPQVSSISSTTKSVLLSLAVTDIGSGLTWLLSAAEAFSYLYGRQSILQNHVHICFMQGLLFLIFVDVSLMSQAIIAVDRLLILTRKKKWTSQVVRMRGIVIGSWIIGSAWCILKAIEFQDYYAYDNKTFLCQNLHDDSFEDYQIAGMVLFVVIPLLIVIAAYARIAFLLKKLFARQKKRPSEGRKKRGIDSGIIQMMKAVVAVFYIFALLYIILVTVSANLETPIPALDFLANVALSATCSVNFIIYLRMNLGFRTKAKENLKWLFKALCPCCLAEVEDDRFSTGTSIESDPTVFQVRRQLQVGFREQEPDIIRIDPFDPFTRRSRRNIDDLLEDRNFDDENMEHDEPTTEAIMHERPNSPQTPNEVEETSTIPRQIGQVTFA